MKETEKVSVEVVRLFKEVFPSANQAFLFEVFEDVRALNFGEWDLFEPLDMAYHNLDHTWGAVLCLARLLSGYVNAGATPEIKATDFVIALCAMLFHDAGYLKRRGDKDGTGAKYTVVHERRSCEVLDAYLTRKGLGFDRGVLHRLVCSTGIKGNFDRMGFVHEKERILAGALCSADYLSQMADPLYVEKLPLLFTELEESDEHQKIPVEKRLFKSAEELIEKTPAFWREVVKPTLEGPCQRLYRFLADPYPDGLNVYLERIEAHIALIEKTLRVIS